MLVNCEQVISLSARFGESFLEEFIERLQVFEPPVLSGSYLTEILTEFDEPLIALMLLCLLPGQNLINLPENDEGSPAVEFRTVRPSIHKFVQPIKIACSWLSD